MYNDVLHPKKPPGGNRCHIDRVLEHITIGKQSAGIKCIHFDDRRQKTRFVSNIAVFVLKRDDKHQLTHRRRGEDGDILRLVNSCVFMWRLTEQERSLREVFETCEE